MWRYVGEWVCRYKIIFWIDLGSNEGNIEYYLVYYENNIYYWVGFVIFKKIYGVNNKIVVYCWFYILLYCIII